ncbi:hypothetical protein B566_EDAN007365 [Ephemera danica]|nr:hypothetical protein B566_EDAN007365 [Ephemera danica]
MHFQAVTGLLRRPDGIDVAAKLPMAVLPLGKTNAVATSIFGQEEKEAKFLAEATMSLIRGSSRLFDAMKIEPIQSDPEVTAKPVYALAEVQWGAYRDTHTLRDKYWIWGPLRAYVGALFCWPKQELSWDCQAELAYIATCEGCKSCQGKHSKAPQTQIQTHSQGRWWQSFLPRSNYSSTNSNIVDYSKVLNPDCGMQHTLSISTTDFSIATANARPFANDTCKPQLQTLQTPELKISIVRELWFQPIDKNKEFITEPKEKPIEAEQTEDKKSSDEAKEAEKWFSIDQENFELRPMHITLLPKSVRLFCPAEQVVQ